MTPRLEARTKLRAEILAALAAGPLTQTEILSVTEGKRTRMRRLLMDLENEGVVSRCYEWPRAYQLRQPEPLWRVNVRYRPHEQPSETPRDEAIWTSEQKTEVANRLLGISQALKSLGNDGAMAATIALAADMLGRRKPLTYGAFEDMPPGLSNSSELTCQKSDGPVAALRDLQASLDPIIAELKAARSRRETDSENLNSQLAATSAALRGAL